MQELPSTEFHQNGIHGICRVPNDVQIERRRLPTLDLGVVNKQTLSHHYHHYHRRRPPSITSSPTSPCHHCRVTATVNVWPHPPASVVHNEHTTNDVATPRHLANERRPTTPHYHHTTARPQRRRNVATPLPPTTICHATMTVQHVDENNIRWQPNDERRLSSFIVFYFQLSEPPSLSTMPTHRHHLATVHNSCCHPEPSPITPHQPRHIAQECQYHATSPSKQASARCHVSVGDVATRRRMRRMVRGQKRRMTTCVVVRRLFYDITMTWHLASERVGWRRGKNDER
jgi:hypothetical protein